MKWGRWALAVAGLYLLSRKPAKPGLDLSDDIPTLTRSQLMDVARQEARAAGIPPWLPLATMDVESGIKHRSPRGSGPGRTFYPMGIQRNRGQDLSGLQGVDLDAALADAQANIHMAIAGPGGLADLYNRYPDDPERIRMGWVMPAYARRGRPWPRKTGSVLTAHRMRRWWDAVQRHGGPSPAVA